MEEWEASLTAREEKLNARAQDVAHREEIVASREEIVRQAEERHEANVAKARSLFVSMEQTKDALIAKFGDKVAPVDEVNKVLKDA